MAKDDLVMGDMGMSMEDCEDLIRGLTAKNQELAAEVAKRMKPSGDTIAAICATTIIIGILVAVICSVYYNDYVIPERLFAEAVKSSVLTDEQSVVTRLSAEASQAPILTDEQLFDYRDAQIYRHYMWDDKCVVRVRTTGEEDAYLHLSKEDYKLIKTMYSINFDQLNSLREMKRKLKAQSVADPPKVRPEY